MLHLPDGENRNGKHGGKIKSENEKTGVNNKKLKNTMLADRTKPMQVLREQSFQKQQVFATFEEFRKGFKVPIC